MKYVALAVLCLSGCSLNVSSPPPYTPTPMVVVTPKDADDCQRAEDKIHSLGCYRSDGSPRWLTPKGAPFAEYCRVAVADDRSPRPDCIALVARCEDIDKAYSTTEGTPCPAN
jgi:hypothetical protein